MLEKVPLGDLANYPLCPEAVLHSNTYSVMFHRFKDLSHPPAARRLPFGLNETHRISPLVFSLADFFQVMVSQSKISPGRSQSPSPLASSLPSGEKATAHTSALWPFNSATRWLRATSRICSS